MSNDSVWVLIGILVLSLAFASGFVVGVWKAVDVFTNPEFLEELWKRKDRKRRRRVVGDPQSWNQEAPKIEAMPQEDKWHLQELAKIDLQASHDLARAEINVRGQAVEVAQELAGGYVNRLFNVTDVLADAQKIANFVLTGKIPDKVPVAETESHVGGQ